MPRRRSVFRKAADGSLAGYDLDLVRGQEAHGVALEMLLLASFEGTPLLK